LIKTLGSNCIQEGQPPSIPPSLLAAKRLTSKMARAAQNVPREGVTVFASRAASDHG
jgi:hypothetical protein